MRALLVTEMPSAKCNAARVPIAQFGRQVAPWGTRARDPEDCVQHAMTGPHDDATDREKIMAEVFATATTLAVEANGTPFACRGIIGAKRGAPTVFLRRPGRAA